MLGDKRTKSRRQGRPCYVYKTRAVLTGWTSEARKVMGLVDSKEKVLWEASTGLELMFKFVLCSLDNEQSLMVYELRSSNIRVEL